MIKTIHYDENYKVIVFDEHIKEYYQMMLLAASDNHHMSKNYKSDILSNFIYMAVWCYKDNPEIMYGVSLDPCLPPNVGRTFNRYYRITNRRSKSPMTDFCFLKSLSFDSDFPEFHKSYGIDTLFYTRNESTKTNVWLSRTTQKLGFEEIQGKKLYKNTPQFFWVKGDKSFLDNIPDS
jgi:hypothetical protein